MMEKVMILSTPQEIAEGLQLLLKQFPVHVTAEPKFESEKMTVSQGSKFIGISYQTLCSWINDGDVPAHGRGRNRFLLKSELIEAYKNLK